MTSPRSPPPARAGSACPGDKLELVRGLCQECSEFDMLEMVEERGSDIFCCKMGTLCAKNILQDVMFVTEGKGVEVECFCQL